MWYVPFTVCHASMRIQKKKTKQNPSKAILQCLAVTCTFLIFSIFLQEIASSAWCYDAKHQEGRFGWLSSRFSISKDPLFYLSLPLYLKFNKSSSLMTWQKVWRSHTKNETQGKSEDPSDDETLPSNTRPLPQNAFFGWLAREDVYKKGAINVAGAFVARK